MSANATLITGSSLCAETKKALGLLEDTIKQLRSEAMSLDELSRHNAHQRAYEDMAKAYSRQIDTQLKYFRDRWGFAYTDEEFGGLYVPRPFGYCKTLLVVPSDLTGPEDIFGKWVAEGKFAVSKYTDKPLNEVVLNDRRRSGHYALLHSGRQKSDVELQNRSWKQNIADRKETMRLTEVLLWEDILFTETKEHIDPDTVTLTSSRGAGGDVAGVRWRRGDDEWYVDGYSPRDARPGLRARAVSL